MRVPFALTLVIALSPMPQATAVSLEKPEAVGRLNHAGYRDRRHCTMAAVGAHAAVTATHCLTGLTPQRTHLLFGFDAMSYAHHTQPAAAHDLGEDLTVLCLAPGDTAPSALPVSATAPVVGEKVTAWGYGRPRVQRAHPTACEVTAVSASQIALSCGLTRGGSGGPVLNAAGELVGVASRASRSQTVAARVLPDVTQVCAVP